jgi:acetyl esterase/lipase
VRTHPPLDPELAIALAALPPEACQPLLAQDIPAVRQAMALTQPDDEILRRGGAVDLEERNVPGPEGAPDLAVLILRPARGRGPWPGLYYVHGGGMVLGSRRSSAAELAAWVEEIGLVAVSVEYRLAPEHPHPAPVEDCYAGLCWTAAHACELGIGTQALIIAGQSAGGGLAAGTALMARDRGGPALSHQILLCPMLDDRAVTPSSQEFEHVGFWGRTSNHTGWTALLGDARGGPAVSPYAAPARAADLTGLPPAFIDVGSVDIFRDEDMDYAARLSRAGLPVEFHLWPGGFHGFEGVGPDSTLARAAVAARLGYLRRVLAGA